MSANQKVTSFPFYQQGNWVTRSIQIQVTAERNLLDLDPLRQALMERLFFLLVRWLVTMKSTVWNSVRFFFPCLNCFKIGDIYPAIVSLWSPLLKKKPLMVFLFRSKATTTRSSSLIPPKTFGRLSCYTQNTVIVPSICVKVNTENQWLWKTELHYLLKKISKSYCTRMQNENTALKIKCLYG